jgi:hypothetical protein
VTYSAGPSAEAATVESVKMLVGPSEEASKEALERMSDMEQEINARYEAMMDRRQQEAEARAKAQEQARAAEQARRAAQSDNESEAESPDYIWYQLIAFRANL